MKYIDVIVPLPLQGTFTYLVPDELEPYARVGMRVIVPFGKQKMYTAIIVMVHTLKPEIYEPKEIISFLDASPILRRPQLKFWEWIADYYMATPGDVFQAAVPAGLKLESETLITVNEDYASAELLPEKEQLLLDCLCDGQTIRLSELSKRASIQNLLPIVKKLLDKRAVYISESLSEKFKPKTMFFLRLSKELEDEHNLQAAFDALSRAPRQLELLMKLIDKTHWFSENKVEISKKEFIDQTGLSGSIINSLVEKALVVQTEKVVGRLQVDDRTTKEPYKLNRNQEEALKQINESFIHFQTVLLHGVTSSGKTEIYSHLIKEVIAKGKQVLYLVPEIALTTQLTDRLAKIFGSGLGVYHSKFSDTERVEIWNKMLSNEDYKLILGVRSSVFLPFRQLGLVIVDEEHETSFKQHDPAPRYHARNASIVLAGMHGAKVLLGTATPSIESYYNAQTSKYGLVELHTRHEDLEMPLIKVVDTKDAYKRKRMTGHFSDDLLTEIGAALGRKEQLILFQNRRGYAPFVECKSCAYVPKCRHCDVSLTYHNHINTLTCHYCGYTEPLPKICPSCNTPSLETRGFGTEKIEDEVKELFPKARVSRMDLDTTRTKKSYQQIIADFEDHKVDILVGTQMVTKGLDFANVSLVGILNADNLLNFPDFRAFERAFQMMSQVSGRAGRKNKQGQVILQTAHPEHPVIAQVISNDYRAMYHSQCEERKDFHYPPYYRMIQITLKHKDVQVLLNACQWANKELKMVFGNRLLGPVIPSVSRIQNYYIRHFVLKLEVEASPAKAKEIVKELMLHLLTQSKFKSVKISYDVDPN